MEVGIGGGGRSRERGVGNKDWGLRGREGGLGAGSWDLRIGSGGWGYGVRVLVVT